MTTVPQVSQDAKAYPPIVHPKAPTMTAGGVNFRPPSDGAGPSAAQPVTGTMTAKEIKEVRP